MDYGDFYRPLLSRVVKDEGFQQRMEELDKLDAEYLPILQSLSPEQYAIYLKYQQARDNLMAEMAAVAYEMGLEDRQAKQTHSP